MSSLGSLAWAGLAYRIIKQVVELCQRKCGKGHSTARKEAMSWEEDAWWKWQF
jgi:hypothetical protein